MFLDFLMRYLEDQLEAFGYGYVIRESAIEEFSSVEEVDNILKSITRELTKDERQLLDIYEKSKGLPNDEHAIYYNESQKFNV